MSTVETPSRPRRRGRIALLVLRVLLILLLVLGLLIAIAWAFGPREPVRLEGRFDAATIGEDIDLYLARTEADVPNLRPGAAKHVRWAYPASKARTPIALVYVHGFTADGAETQPLMNEVAAKLGANLFVTRLAGHGRNGAALAEATIGDWSDDLAEALAIGARLGERVVVVGNSTGATLATMAALQPDGANRIAGLVAIAPNYRILNPRSVILTLPFARDLIARFGPAEYGTPSANPLVEEHWTTRYPSAALLPMARLAEISRRADVASAQVPALFIYAPGDRVVDSGETARIAARWGAPHETLIVDDAGDGNQHVLAGDIVSPGTTDRLADAISTWVGTLPARRD